MHLIGKEFELASHPEANFTWQGSLQLRKNKDHEEYTLKVRSSPGCTQTTALVAELNLPLNCLATVVWLCLLWTDLLQMVILMKSYANPCRMSFTGSLILCKKSFFQAKE